jgi:membrane protease YdiL (CAAX protease family)
MSFPTFQFKPTPVSWTERLLALFEVLLLSGLVSIFLTALIFSAFHGEETELLDLKTETFCFLTLLEAGITLLLLAIILRARRETLGSLGLPWDKWKLHTLLGLGLVPFLFLINTAVSLAFKGFFPEYYIEKNPLTEIIQTPQQLGLFIISALIAGGLKEELQRAFILNRFRRYLGGAAAGLIIWSIAFGAGHYVQGEQGVATAAIYGLVLGILYLLSRSIIAPVVAHAAYNTLALLLYWYFHSRQ